MTKNPFIKTGTPVVGFNHNLSYKARVFHIQTEDSGPQHGHIITHIFLGGNILASTKTSYAETVVRVDATELSATVRKLMEEQHKTMMKGLLSGTHDSEIDKRTADKVYEPGVMADGARAPGLLVGGEKAGHKLASENALPPKPPGKPASQPGDTERSVKPVSAPLASSVPRPSMSGFMAAPESMSPAPIMPPLTPTPMARPNTPGPRGIGNRPLDQMVMDYLLAELDRRR